jgi:hypothetical protein
MYQCWMFYILVLFFYVLTLDFVVSKSFFYLLYYMVNGFVGLFELLPTYVVNGFVGLLPNSCL